MKRKINPFELGMLFVCLFYLYYALKIPFGTIDQPGPGFFPIVLGVVGVAISLVQVIISAISTIVLKKEEDVQPDSAFSLSEAIKEEEKDDWQGTAENKKKMLISILFIMLFAVSYEIVGAIIGLILLTAILCKVYGMRGWLHPFITGMCSSFAIYLVFAVIFKISLPSGLLLGLFM